MRGDAPGGHAGGGSLGLQLRIRPDFAGRLIGRGGQRINAIRADAGVRLHIESEERDGFRQANISGTHDQVLRCLDRVFGPESEKEEEPVTDVHLVLPSAIVGGVIGKGGENIKSIRRASGASVDVERTPPGPQPEFRVVECRGDCRQLRLALCELLATLEKEGMSVSAPPPGWQRGALPAREDGFRGQERPSWGGDRGGGWEEGIYASAPPSGWNRGALPAREDGFRSQERPSWGGDRGGGWEGARYDDRHGIRHDRDDRHRGGVDPRGTPRGWGNDPAPPIGGRGLARHEYREDHRDWRDDRSGGGHFPEQRRAPIGAIGAPPGGGRHGFEAGRPRHDLCQEQPRYPEPAHFGLRDGWGEPQGAWGSPPAPAGWDRAYDRGPPPPSRWSPPRGGGEKRPRPARGGGGPPPPGLLTFEVGNHMAGNLIGTSGATIKGIRQRTGAEFKVCEAPERPGGLERCVVVDGTEEQVDRALEEAFRTVGECRLDRTSQEDTGPGERELEFILIVPPDQREAIFGPDGSRIEDVRAETGVARLEVEGLHEELCTARVGGTAAQLLEVLRGAAAAVFRIAPVSSSEGGEAKRVRRG